MTSPEFTHRLGTAKRRLVRRLVREFGYAYGPDLAKMVARVTNVTFERDRVGYIMVTLYASHSHASVTAGVAVVGRDRYNDKQRFMCNIVKQAVDNLDILLIGVLLSE